MGKFEGIRIIKRALILLKTNYIKSWRKVNRERNCFAGFLVRLELYMFLFILAATLGILFAHAAFTAWSVVVYLQAPTHQCIHTIVEVNRGS